MATFEFQQDTDTYEHTLELTVKGYAGRKAGRITDAASLEEAAAAVDLPAIGDAWSVGLPQLKVVKVTPKYAGGNNYDAFIDYAESQGGSSGTIVPEADLVATTRVETDTVTETARYNVAGDAPLGEDGAAILSTAIRFIITEYRAAFIDPRPLLALCMPHKVNNSALVMPNFQDSGEGISVNQGELLYKSFRLDRAGDLFVMEHEVLWRPDWLWRGVQLGDDGAIIGSYTPQQVYAEASFPAAVFA